MVCRVLLLSLALTLACSGEELSRKEALVWFKGRVLEGLGLDEPPLTPLRGPNVDGVRHVRRRADRASRTTRGNCQTGPNQEKTQIILFPSFDSNCARSDSREETTKGLFTYYFQPSTNVQAAVVTSANFWFYTGREATVNNSAPLFILTSTWQLVPPAERSSDGWSTYHLEETMLTSVAEGPFLLQVRCLACQCHANEPDKMPFLDLRTRPRSARSARHASLNIPWSPLAINLLQRPSQERPEHSDCQRAKVEISFEELGWDNWIVHPAVLNFFYCHGNCSAPDRSTAALGITQCCAPAPGSMRSLRVTTTSDGGHSFKYETLPNIIPEQCTCM
ncbi:inhibin alpha chain [Solea senegalensis]|uniref:Inhibin alpha chain n=1 Tax=Solea senegalensis TaxID=28829 RepID=A0AAV6RDQ2_SOLSE|nr:inhibin alpha chain [Solea senegalensis]KAG7502422.1 inhibin alpha chain [Solea senegalensis]